MKEIKEIKNPYSCFILFGVLSLSFVAFAQDLSITPSVEKGPAKLESNLYQLTQADDYNEFAKARGLYVENGKVRVVIELKTPDYKLQPEFGIEESRYENLLQGLVYADKLTILADEPSINYIRPPYVPDLQINNSENSSADKKISATSTKEMPVSAYAVGGIAIAIALAGYFFLKRKGKTA